MGGPRWELFPHDADVGVRGIGKDPAAAFEQAALALTASVTDPARVVPRERVDLACSAPDLELLLTDWLNAVIGEMSSRRMLFGRFEVAIRGTHLEAHAWGEPVDRARHEPAAEPKGATYTRLSVHRAAGGDWVADCVVDV